MKNKMTPEQMSLAYRIWGVCEPVGWNLTPGDIADLLEVSHQQVVHILRLKRWQNRVRTSRMAEFGLGPTTLNVVLPHQVRDLYV